MKIDIETTSDCPDGLIEVSVSVSKPFGQFGSVGRQSRYRIPAIFKADELAKDQKTGKLVRVIDMSIDFDAAQICWEVEELDSGKTYTVSTMDLEKTSALRELGEQAE